METPGGKYIKTLSYQPASGWLVWRVTGGRKRIGQRAGWLASNGYRYLSLGGKKYLEHHIVWYLHHNKLPELDIDHVNRIRSDNRIENLREVDRSTNNLNTTHSKNNKLKVRGVIQLPSGKFRAVITRAYKQKHLGVFNSIKEAESAIENYLSTVLSGES